MEYLITKEIRERERERGICVLNYGIALKNEFTRYIYIYMMERFSPKE